MDIRFEPVIGIVELFGARVMRFLFPETSLAKQISISMGNSVPKLSVMNQRTSSYTIQIRSDLNMFDVIATKMFTNIVANCVQISTAQPQLDPSTDKIGYLQTRSFEIPSALITEEAKQIVAALRSANPVSAVDRLHVVVDVQAVLRTRFSHEFLVTCEIPLQMEVTN
jgi:hypothetical protein